MSKKKTPKKAATGARIYWREQKGGEPKAYGDFRGFRGGKREALIAPGGRGGTTDPVLAQELFAKRLRELTDAADAPVTPTATGRKTTISQAVAAFIEYKAARKAVGEKWVEEVAAMLGRAVAHFGSNRRLSSITADDVVGWLDALRVTKNPRGDGYSEQTRRHHLNALSQVFRRGQRVGWVGLGYSPTMLLEKEERPSIPASTTEWLEVDQAAKLLEAARLYPVSKKEPRMVLAYPVIATLLLTGGRADEVLGLEVRDIDFGGKRVHFRPTKHRRGKKGKTEGARRSVPLFPQLEEILRAYLEGAWLDLITRRPDVTLLFPSPKTLGRITDIRDLVDKPAARAGLPTGLYRSRALRITYCSARLQTLDHGAPVAPSTVMKEMGHETLNMVEAVYGRVGQHRARSDFVEFRIARETNPSANTADRGCPAVPATNEESVFRAGAGG